MTTRRSASASSVGGDGEEQDSGKDGKGSDKGKRVVGRLRGYLKPDNGRDFDLDGATPEARLVDPDAPSWYIPSGREPWLRRRSGMKAKDVQSRDVGRFKLSDFSTRATDERGHDKGLKVSMPPQLLNELAAINDSKVFPTRSLDGLARTLIYEGVLLLHEIARQDGLVIPNSHTQQLEALATLNRNTQAVLAFDDMLEQSCELVRTLQGRGARNKARTTVHDMLAIVKKIPSGELRERWRRDIELEFKDVLRGRPAQVHPKRRATDVDDPEMDEE